MKTAFHPDGVLLNPRAEMLGVQNAILSGSATHHYVPEFEGCLSLKSVIAGSAVWETPGRRFKVHENTYLILNDRQHYQLTIDSAHRVTTFCVFFERGFVEDVFRSKTSPASALLDDPQRSANGAFGFIERLEPLTGSVSRELQTLRRRLAHGSRSSADPAADLYRLAERIIARQLNITRLTPRLPAVRNATRVELLRRVLRGRDFLLSALAEAVSLKDAARAACLSPFHFHRSFQAAFGETPHQHAIRHRLDRARELLARTERSITEICFEAGFESLGSFSTLFRRAYGVAPRDYRRRKN